MAGYFMKLNGRVYDGSHVAGETLSNGMFVEINDDGEVVKLTADDTTTVMRCIEKTSIWGKNALRMDVLNIGKEVFLVENDFKVEENSEFDDGEREVVAGDLVKMKRPLPGEQIIISVSEEVYSAVNPEDEVTLASGGSIVKIGLNVTGGEWVYDGQAHSVVASVVGGTGYSIKYKVGSGSWGTSVPSITNVGESTVSVKATKDGSDPLEAGTTLKVTPRPIEITVNDASKTVGDNDPSFTGAITSTPGLVSETDLGTITYVRTNVDVEDVGVYEGVIDANYTANTNYDVVVKKGNFEIVAAD